MEVVLTEQQQSAYESILQFVNYSSDAFYLLEGYAGTGKTTLVGKLVEELHGKIMRPDIAIMAPTNKAVGVLMSKLPVGDDIEHGSLHSFLGMKLNEREDGQHECKPHNNPTLHKYDLAIVDEASMVSEELMKYIIALRNNCQVLFVGDPAQLPPVGDNHISPVFRTISNKSTLTDIVRQAADNPIISASVTVRNAIIRGGRAQINDLVKTFGSPPSPAGVVVGGTLTAINGLVDQIMDGHDCRAIAFTNDKVKEINQYVHQAIYPDARYRFSPSERVIVNDEYRARSKNKSVFNVRLFNSEELIVNAVHDDGDDYMDIPLIKVLCERDSGQEVVINVPLNIDDYDYMIKKRWRKYHQLQRQRQFEEARTISKQNWSYKKFFCDLRHTYAMTAHKSQGSTFATSLVMFDNLSKMRDDMDFNKSLYVAMTRASDRMAIVLGE